jgi:uncharacterized membrane protein YeiH
VGYTGLVLFHVLDLVGVFAFALLAAREARQHGFNWVGIALCAFLAALGGGTIRSLILDQTPAYFNDYSYSLAVAAGFVASFIAQARFQLLRPLILLMDTVGVIVFACIGAGAALAAGLGPVGCMIMAALTAAGGGVLCNLLTRTKPVVLSRPAVYLSPAILTGLIWWLGAAHPTLHHLAMVSIAVPFIAQLTIAYAYPQTVYAYLRRQTRQHISLQIYRRHTVFQSNE